MSQGSINQPSQQKSGIEGILQALQAVHQVYGINTEKTQQKLLASKIKQEEPKDIEADARASELKDFISGKGPGRFMLKDAGYIDDPNNQAPQQNPTLTPVRDTMASNDSVASDAPGFGPIVGHVQKISDFSQPQSSSASLSTATARTVSLPGGGTATMVPGLAMREQQQKYQNDVLTGQEKQLGLKQKAQEMTLKDQDQKNKIVSGFMEGNPEAKTGLEDMYGARGVSNMLLSGNYKGQAAGADKLKLLSIGVSRLNPAVLESIDPNKVTDIIKEVISKKTTNGLPPEELDLLHKTAQLVEKNALQKLDQAGSMYADQHAPVYGINSEEIKNKYLFPKGLQSLVPDTAIAISPKTQKPTLFYLNKGKMRAVSSGE